MATPMMQQYQRIKDQNPDCLLFFRLGDFYEMFNEDALTASEILDITLTTRDRGVEKEEDRTPMCGVPYHSAEAYIARLIQKGHKVAICEQTEDPALAKGLVNREVVRIITPGTVMESSLLEEGRNNFICGVYLDSGSAGLCVADISTGEAYATEVLSEDKVQGLLGEIGRFCPKEAVVNDGAVQNTRLMSFLRERLGCLVQTGGEGRFRKSISLELISSQFNGQSVETLGLEGKDAAILAAGGLISYLREMAKNGVMPLGTLNVYEQNRFMELDFTARRNLELTESLRSGEKKGTLLWVLDHTGTAMGSRLLRAWLEKPLTNPGDIMRRQYAVGELTENVMARGELRGVFKGLPDVERLISRIVYGTANARDMRSLAQAAARMPLAHNLLEPLKANLLAESRAGIDSLTDIHDRLSRAITEDPPFSIREGGYIRDGYDPEVDRLRGLVTNARAMVAAMEAEEKTKTGIKTLKVGYNRVFGYYIEVSKSYYGQVPEHYIRKQTLASCERYITQELKTMEGEILSANEKLVALEGKLFEELRVWLSGNAHRVQRTAQALAQIDTLNSLAEAAYKYGYVMPSVDYSEDIEIKEGRHPVVERMMQDGLFVPNDTVLSGKSPTAIITGPNMAGKSTYMRQVAQIVLMAQIGSFVSAKSARIGVVDRVFTRIGAQDDLAGGRSTFMVEMSEVADILRYATRRSLIVLDEVGRGTSTFDGMSVARAVLEHVHKKIGAKTLFATHYHELIDMEHELEGLKNYNVAVKKRGGDIIFLRRIVQGGADDSFGVEVAKLAGLPDAVISRARVILKELENGGSDSTEDVMGDKKENSTRMSRRSYGAGMDNDSLSSSFGGGQISLDGLTAQEIKKELEKLDVNTLTPIEAINKLFELHKKAKE